ncbi:nucleotidyltransferase domain-containing protein [Faecalispora anaeroviscerum]|uniref:nucleotidyltransferase domain-containing protein n=1 Tax=Faecalispora anaeroviscerum TaxID=2991836 RepID=UPI0024B9BD30|nr:nucleotidyltransferase domain-containing protein [Faecalispora anaeroviscerum]
MINIQQWMKQYQAVVCRLFGSRVLFIGLQGSYGRNEAHETSDIDVVMILDTVSLSDLKQYKQAIDTLPESSQICGFVSGKEELAGWYRADLFQFYHDTTPYYGSLDSILPEISNADARNAVWMGACNLYHMCSHNYLHSGHMETVKALYKSAAFVLQAKHYAETGSYVRSHIALEQALTGADLEILQCARQLQSADISQVSLDQFSERMLQWAQKLIVH